MADNLSLQIFYTYNPSLSQSMQTAVMLSVLLFEAFTELNNTHKVCVTQFISNFSKWLQDIVSI